MTQTFNARCLRCDGAMHVKVWQQAFWSDNPQKHV